MPHCDNDTSPSFLAPALSFESFEGSATSDSAVAAVRLTRR